MKNHKFSKAIRIICSWLIMFIIIYPIYWIIVSSVRPVDEILSYPPKLLPNISTMTFKHYITVLNGEIGSSTNSYGLITFLKNSIIISVLTTSIALFVSLLAGYSLVRVSFKGSKIASHIILACHLMPGVALLIPMFMMAVKLHLNNSLYGLILFQSAGALPLGIWLTKAFLKGIPISIEESAYLDGCNRIQIILKIILPLSIPGLVVVGFNTFLASWNSFILPSILIDKESIKPLMVGLYLYFNQNIGVIWGEVMAAAFIAMIPIFFLFFYYQKYIVGGLTAGAVKG